MSFNNIFFISCRKGPLLLFSEDLVTKAKRGDNNRNFYLNNYEDIPIKTVSEFQKNVLFYGLFDKKVRKKTNY